LHTYRHTLAQTCAHTHTHSHKHAHTLTHTHTHSHKHAHIDAHIKHIIDDQNEGLKCRIIYLINSLNIINTFYDIRMYY